MPDNSFPDDLPDDPASGDMPPDPFGHGDPFDVSETGSFHPAEDNVPSQHDEDNLGSGTGREGSDPFGGFGSILGPMMGDLTKMLAQQTQDGWQQARHYAVLRASGDTSDTASPSPAGDPAVDPLDRIRIQELVSIVERHVVDATGLELAGPKGLKIAALTRAGWAADFLDAHRELLKPVLESPSPPIGGTASGAVAGSPEALLSGLLGAVGPSMMAMQVGAMAGQLAHRYFGSGDLPLPRKNLDSVSFIPSNMARFAQEWSLPIDSLRVRVAIDELALHTIVRLPQIAHTLRVLIVQHASGFRVDPTAMMERLGDLAGDPGAASERLLEMAQLAASTPTPEQSHAAQSLQRLNAIIGGYVGHVGDLVSAQLLGGDHRVAEAMHRRRLQPDDATDMLAQLTGLKITAEQHERGAAFISGVLNRTGDNGAVPLAALWATHPNRPSNLPTDAELDAPGLWLARIEVQEQ